MLATLGLILGLLFGVCVAATLTIAAFLSIALAYLVMQDCRPFQAIRALVQAVRHIVADIITTQLQRGI